MPTIFEVYLDDHQAHLGLNYEEAKEIFLEWVDYLKTHHVTYSRVRMIKNALQQEVLFEFIKK